MALVRQDSGGIVLGRVFGYGLKCLRGEPLGVVSQGFTEGASVLTIVDFDSGPFRYASKESRKIRPAPLVCALLEEAFRHLHCAAVGTERREHSPGEPPDLNGE